MGYNRQLDGGVVRRGPTSHRQSVRSRSIDDVILRRNGGVHHRVKLHDISPHGCKVDFVERPELDEHVWVKIDQLEALESVVCWIEDWKVGLEFTRPIHPAVFDTLVRH